MSTTTEAEKTALEAEEKETKKATQTSSITSENEPSHLSMGQIALLVAALVFCVAVGLIVFVGAPLALIFLAASALCGAIALIWSSLQAATESDKMDFEEALSLAAPGAEEEQKLAVLRALKDLEYELSVGKITKEDFDVANAEYRAEARRLIALQDETMKAQMEKATELAEKHIASAQKSLEKSAQPSKKEKEGRA